MSTVLYGVAYFSLVVFLVAVIGKIVRYKKYPIHVRWELYPVAHEAKRVSYGGSYLEEVDWVNKPREVSLMTTLKVMLLEIFLLKAVHEFNRPLWYATYPFHLGLYLCCGFIGLLFGEALGLALNLPIGPESGLGSAINSGLLCFGISGFALTFLGAMALFFKRLTDQALRDYSSPSHFFNLGGFMAVTAVSLAAWCSDGHGFASLRTFVAGFITLRLTPIDNDLVALQLVLAAVLIAYIPLTHMAHFFMKYFLYHDIRWGDTPSVNNPEMSKRIAAVLGYRVSWSAAHIGADGHKTWAEIATTNPTASAPKAKKE